MESLIEILNSKARFYNSKNFIETDPISVPHRYTKKEDIEIAGLFAATLAWGQRTTIIKNASWLMDRMDNSPFDFITNHSENDFKAILNIRAPHFQWG
jgi:hypothetical protein